MKLFYYLTIIVFMIILFSCTKWEDTRKPNYVYLPIEAESQGDTIYVDTLEFIHFSYDTYEIKTQFQIAEDPSFSRLVFDSHFHEYDRIPTGDFTVYAQIPIMLFVKNKTYYSRIRHRAESAFPPASYYWSEWSKIGYFIIK